MNLTSARNNPSLIDKLRLALVNTLIRPAQLVSPEQQRLLAQAQVLADENRFLKEKLAKTQSTLAQTREGQEQVLREQTAKDELLRDRNAQLELLSQRGTCHPLYGELLFQAGNRRIFSTPPTRILNKELFPIYLHQRAYQSHRAEQMAQSIRKDDRFAGFPGAIIAFELEGEAAAATKGNQVRGIVDGQHRIGAIELLVKSGHWPETRPVLMEVHTTPDPLDAARLFKQINKMQPVLDIDLAVVEAEILGDKAKPEHFKVKAVIDQVAETLRMQFPEMFKPSMKCQIPHVNIDVLRNKIFQDEQLRAIAQDSGPDGLLEYLLKVNDKISKLEVKAFPKKGYEKAVKHGFFLGMGVEWSVFYY